MKTETKRTVAAKLMLFSSAVIWGSSFFILKNTLDELPVYFLLCVRSVSYTHLTLPTTPYV